MTNSKHASQHNPAPSISQLSAPDAVADLPLPWDATAGDHNYEVGDLARNLGAIKQIQRLASAQYWLCLSSTEH